MFQRLWCIRYDWDEELPANVCNKWLEFRQQYRKFNSLIIPRWIQTTSNSIYQLCGFSDASESAYAAVIYCRVLTNDTIKVNLLTSKTKVSPLRQVSLPRLELSAALLLARLLKAVATSLNTNNVQLIAWTDSAVVLGWLSSYPRRWKTYVANRVSEISNILPRKHWHHISSNQNPADLATRGMQPHLLLNCSLWWTGPKWLMEPDTSWPQSKFDSTFKRNDIAREERKNQLFSFQLTKSLDVFVELLSKFSKLDKTLRIIAAWNCVVIRRRDTSKQLSPHYAASELKNALKRCIKWSQHQHYSNEIKLLQKGKALPNNNRIAKLIPLIDASGIIRINGRLNNSNCGYDTKHPIVISKNCILAHRIIAQEHLRNLHAGPTLLICTLRQRFWITSCRRLVKNKVNRCVVCARFRANLSSQQMVQLPSYRVENGMPFNHVGIDYCGPIMVKLHKGRNAKNNKAYIAVFVCLGTKAIHLELVSDMSSDAFIMALKRFVDHRGIPSSIHSDNGTNFVGANRKLVKIFKLVQRSEDVCTYLARQNINWKFTPPGAPHFRGIWEAAVKATKFHLRRLIVDYKLTFEEISTLLCEIEAQLNSRPVVSIYDDDIDNINVLTPAHFLVGKPINQLPEPNIRGLKPNYLPRWKLITRLQQEFWEKWRKYYLTSLQHQNKWYKGKQNLKPGDVVLIADESTQPSIWPMGIVAEVHPGRDNLVRAATVKTSKGIMKRPIVKLCKLPTDG